MVSGEEGASLESIKQVSTHSKRFADQMEHIPRCLYRRRPSANRARLHVNAQRKPAKFDSSFILLLASVVGVINKLQII